MTTRETAIQFALEADPHRTLGGQLARIIERAILAEREACRHLARNYFNDDRYINEARQAACAIATAIAMRSDE